MQLPLSFFDITLWLAITAIILLVTVELISPNYGRLNILIDKNRLRLTSLLVGIAFIVNIILNLGSFN
jgi:hypothetical protein